MNLETDRVPTAKSSRHQGYPTSHIGCNREERHQNNAQRALANRMMARRRLQRRSLKESGDYLGVQGVNPLTGEPDQITPFSSDERSELSVDTKQGHVHVPRNFTSGGTSGDRKMVGDIGGQDSVCLDRMEAVFAPPTHGIQVDKSQWSSAQEPNLSTIEQSSLSDVSNAGNQQKRSQPVDTGSTCLVEISPPTHVSLLMDSPDNIPAGGLGSSVSGPQDASSCGTVVRPNERHPSRSPSSVLELHENGIVFDNPTGGRQRDDEDTESLQELAQSTGATSQKERHITFASPPAAPAIRGPRPVTPVRSLYLDQLKVPDFHSPRPAADPREERQRETKASNPGTKDRDKDISGVLSVRQCSDRSSWIRKRALKSAASEECPFRKRLLRDQIKLSGDSALVENRLPQADTPTLSAETVNGGQTLELVVEGNWSMAHKNARFPETIRRSNFTNKQQTGIFTSSTSKDPATTIYDLPTMSPVRDPIQDQGKMLVLLEGKEDAGVAELSREDGLQRKMDAYSRKMSTETLEEGRKMLPQEAAGKRTSPVGSASSTAAGLDNQLRGDSTDKDQKVPSRHVQGALERLRKSQSWSSNWDSRMPPTPSSSSNSQIHRVDTQGHDSTPIRQRPRRLTKKQQLERVVDELLMERCTVPTSTSTSARQASRITASGMMDPAAWDMHLNMVMPEGREQLRMSQQPGYQDGDGEGGAAQTPGGPREKAVLAVAHVMVLGVKIMRLYRHYLCSCLRPRSELWDRSHSGTITPPEAAAVIITVWVTFYISFGLYTAFVCFWDALQNIWKDEMYDY